ncbi:MAG: right-handed parallel beta-helix repeat-containing protein [Candidatus Bathyarchaeia archaeon]|jgi:hypothetical protein
MHKAITCSLLFSFVLLSITPITHLSQATGATLPSIISSDTTLTQSGSPYSLIGPTRVNSGVTLRLEAGAILIMGNFYLQVDGTLRSMGASGNPAQILSSLPISMSDSIGYINFTDSCTSWNEQTNLGCILENTLINQTRIYIGNSIVKINSDTINFQGNPMVDNVALYINGGATPVTNNVINAAIITQGGTSTISANTITGGMGLYGGSPTVTNNRVSGGSTYIYFAKDENRVYNTIAISSDCSPTVSNNDVAGSIHSGDYRQLQGYATITNNTVKGGITGQANLAITNNRILGGISTTGVNVNIQGNQISGTGSVGVSVSDDAIVKYNSITGFNVSLQVNPSSIGSSNPTIKNNNIQNWIQYCIKTLTSTDIDASSNWWGTTDIQTIKKDVYDQTYDFNLGKINITPILNEPNTQAPEAQPVEVSPTPSSTAQASPSPTVPEYSTVAVIALLAAATMAIVSKKKTSGLNLLWTARLSEF